MQRVRVVRGVHRHRVRVVVNRNIHTAADRQLNARTRPAAAGKVINDDFSHAYSPIALASDRAAVTMAGTGIFSSHMRLM
ncbi:hypothetical protein D3C72_2503820 [compost metagenome]